MADAVLIAGTDAKSPLISIALQGILYGFSTCMFGMTIWVLGFQRSLRGSSLMLCTAFVLWALPTARMCIDITITVRAFVEHISAGPRTLGPEEYLSSFWLPVSLLDNAIYGVQTLVGEAVVIYRCYVVWQKRWIIVLPCVAWLGGLGSLMYVLDIFAEHDVSGQKGLLIYCFTLAANLLATTALAYRIWQVDREASSLRSHRNGLRPVLIVIIESGAIYTAVLIIALITALHALSVEYVINSFIPAIISITFNMIFMRIGLSRASSASTDGSTTHAFPLSTIMFNHGTLDNEKDVGGKDPQLTQSSSVAPNFINQTVLSIGHPEAELQV